MDMLLVGTIGAGILLACFLLNQLNILRNNGFLYDVGNFIGASLLLVYAYDTGSWPFVVLELVWAAASLRDIARDIAYGGKGT